ncbi:MAG: AAA family ATPase [Spirochaetota bacterium]
MDAWEDKANLILSGPPGTGKSWLAARLAWIMIGAEDADRLLRIQFHQSYAYEDFVRGWKPGAGSFELKDGPFLSFCERARADGTRPYVVLIEEINRGDISRVFGELFFLLEKDKRENRYAMRLSCSKDGEAPFFVPPNLYLIGMYMPGLEYICTGASQAPVRRISWARLILRSAAPEGGLYRLDDPLDRSYLNRAFESFIRKALRESLAGEAHVRRQRFHWNPRDKNPGSLVPVMETDAKVLGHDRCLIVDAKYYGRPLIYRYGRLQFHSSHLYQIASYLRALRSRDSLCRPWSACLVYAQSGESFNHCVDLDDFGLQALGLDLEQEPQIILSSLASIWSVDRDQPSPFCLVHAPLTARTQA